jgi:FKBP-type peptidyl-prolyl cis-trans isomerase (trigger factor)
LLRIGEREKITVEEKDMETRIAQIAESSRQKVESVFEYLHTNEMLEDMYGELWEGKLIDFLIAAAAVTETEVAEKPPAKT